MDFSSDEYFGTLGGSLMKDLLADLQVDDGDFSLDQLEKELATLDQDPLQLQTQPILPMDAASLVVSHAQERASAMPTGATLPSQGFDAWSLSLQNFTAMSLQEDFLAADSARKKQHGTPQAMQHILVEGAEDYDIGEKALLTPPPGLGGPPAGFASEPPEPFPFPKTPQNSVNFGIEESAKLKDALRDALGVRQTQKASSQELPGPSRQGTVAQTTPVVAVPSHEAAFIPGPTPGVTPAAVDAMLPTQPINPPLMMPPHPAMVPVVNAPPPPHLTSQPNAMAPVVVMPPPVRGPVWQAPPPPVPQPILVYCNPHPAAPPIPATALETKYMSARDIAYVVHSILKPVLAEKVSEDDYYIQFLRRLGGHANPNNPRKPKDLNEEMLSRANKSKEWSSEKGVLGHVAKSNVARPRALIASPLVPSNSEQDSEQKQRATLWKARIYCDQGYQAYQTVVDIWRSAPPGGVPPQVQIHLVKLMKCMGITHVDKEYQLDRASLTLLLKLSKGRTLTARVLEQALLPPNAVQSLLPLLLDVLFSSTAGKKGQDDHFNSDEFSVERLFRAVAGVVQKLNLTSDTLLQCLEVVQKNGKHSLESPARMECTHTLLQKGSIVIAHDPSEEKRAAWGKAEGEFMNILQAF